MNSRKEARHAIADLIRDNVPILQAVYDHTPPWTEGLAPFAWVMSDGTGPPATLTGGRQHALFVSIWWLLADVSEDELDDLSEAVLDVIADNAENPGVWEYLTVDEDFSIQGAPEIENGGVYRIEQFRVIVY